MIHEDDRVERCLDHGSLAGLALSERLLRQATGRDVHQMDEIDVLPLQLDAGRGHERDPLLAFPGEDAAFEPARCLTLRRGPVEGAEALPVRGGVQRLKRELLQLLRRIPENSLGRRVGEEDPVGLGVGHENRLGVPLEKDAGPDLGLAKRLEPGQVLDENHRLMGFPVEPLDR